MAEPETTSGSVSGATTLCSDGVWRAKARLRRVCRADKVAARKLKQLRAEALAGWRTEEHRLVEEEATKLWGADVAAVLWERLTERLPPRLMSAALAAFVAANKRLPRDKEAWEHEGLKVNLGSWLFSRRTQQLAGALDPALVAGIQAAVGPELAAGLWEKQPAPVQVPPETWCAALAAFVASCRRLPKDAEDWPFDGQQVKGQWLSNCRQRHKAGTLDTELQQNMEAAVGQEYVAQLWAPREAEQYQMVAALAAFVAEERRLPKAEEPWKHEGQQMNLGQWLKGRRQQHKKAGGLHPGLKSAIEEAVGSALEAELWQVKAPAVRHPPEVMCAALEAFAAERKRLPTQTETWTHEGQQRNLGSWLASRRSQQRDDKLKEELQAAIEAAVGPTLAAGLWERRTTPVRQPADLMCAALAAFVAAHDQLPKSKKTWVHEGQELPLGDWLYNRQREQQRGDLSDAQQEKIQEAAGQLAAGLWEKKSPRARLTPEEWCAALAAFVTEHGRLPKSSDWRQQEGQQPQLGVTGKQLAMWVSNRRQAWKKNKPDQQLEEAIEAAVGSALAAALW